MTMTDTTPLNLRGLTDAELLDLARSDGTVAARALAEAGRRDRDDRLARGRRALADIRAEGDRQAYAQYRAASDSEQCKGRMLSPEGMRAFDRGEIREDLDLWRIPEDKALRYCSEELGLWWEHVSPRVTSEDYVHQHAAERRKAEDEARNGHDAGTGLAGHEAGALRREGTSEVLAESAGGGDRAVQRGGHRAAASTEGQPARRDGRAGGPVQPDRGLEGATDMGVITRAVVHAAREDQRKARQAGDVAVPVTGVVRSPGGTVARQDAQLVPGDQLLDLIRDGWFGHFCRLPSPAALDLVTLWAAHCWMRDENGVLVFRATPRLYVLSSEPGSGKSHLLELLALIVPNCFGLDLEPTAPGLVYTISREKATVLIDEGDCLFATGARRQAVRAILNGGYTRHGTYLNGKGAKASREPVFGPVAVAGLDTMETDTGDTLKALLSRGVKIRMQKAASDDRPPKMTAASEDAAAKVRHWLGIWAGQVRGQVADAQPEVPEGLEGRPEQIWIPLFAVADAAGGSWPERARAACRELTMAEPGDSDLAAEFEQFAASFGAV
jgi:hypothetical protein